MFLDKYQKSLELGEQLADSFINGGKDVISGQTCDFIDTTNQSLMANISSYLNDELPVFDLSIINLVMEEIGIEKEIIEDLNSGYISRVLGQHQSDDEKVRRKDYFLSKIKQYILWLPESDVELGDAQKVALGDFLLQEFSMFANLTQMDRLKIGFFISEMASEMLKTHHYVFGELLKIKKLI